MSGAEIGKAMRVPTESYDYLYPRVGKKIVGLDKVTIAEVRLRLGGDELVRFRSCLLDGKPALIVDDGSADRSIIPGAKHVENLAETDAKHRAEAERTTGASSKDPAGLGWLVAATDRALYSPDGTLYRLVSKSLPRGAKRWYVLVHDGEHGMPSPEITRRLGDEDDPLRGGKRTKDQARTLVRKDARAKAKEDPDSLNTFIERYREQLVGAAERQSNLTRIKDAINSDHPTVIGLSAEWQGTLLYVRAGRPRRFTGSGIAVMQRIARLKGMGLQGPFIVREQGKTKWRRHT